MAILFEVEDPRGFTVICTEDVWERHILAKRPFMVGSINEVKLAIEKPVIGIYQDVTYAARNIYYGDHSGRVRYMKVVVEFNQENMGYVITAFTAVKGREGETLIWPIKFKA